MTGLSPLPLNFVINLKEHAQENVAPHFYRKPLFKKYLWLITLTDQMFDHDFLANGYIPRIHMAPAHSGQSANTFREGKDCYLINNSLFY